MWKITWRSLLFSEPREDNCKILMYFQKLKLCLTIFSTICLFSFAGIVSIDARSHALNKRKRILCLYSSSRWSVHAIASRQINKIIKNRFSESGNALFSPWSGCRTGISIWFGLCVTGDREPVIITLIKFHLNGRLADRDSKTRLIIRQLGRFLPVFRFKVISDSRSFRSSIRPQIYSSVAAVPTPADLEWVWPRRFWVKRHE